MQSKPSLTRSLCFFILAAALLASGCASAKATPPSSPTTGPTSAPTATPDLPSITGAIPDRIELPRYESLELSVALKAKYANPYDLRQVSLDAVFAGPQGLQMKVPGFWDGEAAWRVRFTPSQVGAWSYRLTVTDTRGVSQPVDGKFMVTASDLHGWLQMGSTVNPAYSSHYLVYQDGTPFYGVGHNNAFSLLADGFSLAKGVGQFNLMKQVGENYVVWWPLWSNPLLSTSYNDYTVSNMKVIDLIVADAQKQGIFLVFTIWDHPELRDTTHKTSGGKWNGNGFNQLGDINSFFTSAEAWAWQENFYRYMIARWGYSPAIGMWQTVAEISETNAYDQTNPWHAKVNYYFVANDPYRHPTTASMKGDLDWPEGHLVMDAPQMHVYDFRNGALKVDVVKAAKVMAGWTSLMWNRAAKPNWIGEFGSLEGVYYPELFHNSIWASLASGSAMEPADWNTDGLAVYAGLMPAIAADNTRLAKFVANIPLAKLDPVPLQIVSHAAQVRGWGVAGQDGGLFWVQDFSMEGKTIEAVRSSQALRKGVSVDLLGLAGGNYTITPYDTWLGTYLTALSATCTVGQPCTIALPDFKADLAFKIEKQ